MSFVLVPFLLAGHTAGLAQGTIVVDDDRAADRVVVTVDLVFARADAAHVAGPVVTVVGSGCQVEPPVAVDVEDDGRSVALTGRCPRDIAIVVDVVGLAALPADHRTALRVVDDVEQATVLSPVARQFTIPPRGSSSLASRGWPIVGAGLAVVVVVLGRLGRRRARQRGTTRE